MRKFFAGMRDRPWTSLSVSIVFSSFYVHSAVAQTPSNTSMLTIVSPRPVLQAIEDLTAKYGYVVTYAEPKVIYSGDVEDITKRRRTLGKVVPRRVLAPLGGKVQLTMPSTARISKLTMYALLQQLVQLWTDSDQGGAHFQVEQGEGAFHVVPTEVRDKNGNWQPVDSILATAISLPTVPRTALETFKAIANAVGANAGVRVFPVVNGGVMLGGSPDATKYVIGAQEEPAASVLMRVFKSMGIKRTWFLLYDPTMRAYVLNIDDVQPPPSATAPPSGPSVPAVRPAQAPSTPRSCPACSDVHPPPPASLL